MGKKKQEEKTVSRIYSQVIWKLALKDNDFTMAMIKNIELQNGRG